MLAYFDRRFTEVPLLFYKNDLGKNLTKLYLLFNQITTIMILKAQKEMDHKGTLGRKC
jgi:hypothetical protein